MKSLIVGMGIGQLYKAVLSELGHTIITVDQNPAVGADFTDVESALWDGPFDTVHICTPNFTHESIARLVAPISKIVFVEKPGLQTAKHWADLVASYPNAKFMMVKNNMWRDNITELRTKAQQAKAVNIDWIRKNCVPHPGSWFTTRELAFGGVSRDLMPHLLSWYIALNDDWATDSVNGYYSLQNWTLADISSTDYGKVYPSGVYDVDDKCSISFSNKWHATANWRSIDTERSAITFINQDNTQEVFELGWCPEYAYKNMIADAIANLNNTDFWDNQLKQDLWIHQQIEKL